MKKYYFIILLAGLAVLILFQQKVIMPLVLDVVKSDLFLKENKDLASQIPITSSLTNLAFIHCNTFIKADLGSDTSITFPDKPLNVWTLGNYHYVVNAEINVSKDSATPITKKYACRIDYKNGDDEEGSAEYDNWSIEGVDGLEDINAG
jgi:hypothetical protein